MAKSVSGRLRSISRLLLALLLRRLRVSLPPTLDEGSRRPQLRCLVGGREEAMKRRELSA